MVDRKAWVQICLCDPDITAGAVEEKRARVMELLQNTFGERFTRLHASEDQLIQGVTATHRA